MVSGCKGGEESEEIFCEFQQEDAMMMDLDSSESREGSVRPDQVFGRASPSCMMDDEDGEEYGRWTAEGDELLEQLIEVSIRKIHQLQSFHRKDERRRVLIVNMLHSLLMRKIVLLKEEGDLVGEDSTLLNELLQEKIRRLGLGRTVRIWVDAPKKPGQVPTLQLPVKGGAKKERPTSSRKAEDVHGPSATENSLAPSGRDTASY